LVDRSLALILADQTHLLYRKASLSRMSFTYAIPDLHGCFELLELAIAKITEHSAGERSTIVTLGDYVDRGPNSRQVMERLINWRSDTLELVSLKGNHEAMMWEVCNNLAELDWWTENGGDRTLASYEKGFDPRSVPSAHLEWIANLPLMHVDKYRVFVHAGVDPALPLNQQREQILLWKRYSGNSEKGHGSRHVVHGHRANRKAPIVTQGRTNLDGMAWKTGRLVVGIFHDSVPGGPIEALEIIGRSEF
jgi:serine/threonine protein phosphatase 1